MNDYDETDDPIFTFDKVMGGVLDFLGAVGIFCAIVAALLFAWGT